MIIDEAAFNDLSIFNADSELSLFSKFDWTVTSGGRYHLRSLFRKPLENADDITETQDIVRLMMEKLDQWPKGISNGSIMVVYKFYETVVDNIPLGTSYIAAYFYRWLHFTDYGLVRYSAFHTFDFIQAFGKIIELLRVENCPAKLKKSLDRAHEIMDKPEFDIVFSKKSFEELTLPQMLSFASFIRYHYKLSLFELIDIYSELDAWMSMGAAMKEFNLVFPDFVGTDEPTLQIEGLYHPLLRAPVPYDVTLNEQKNFIFLTGANMAGKSTFIKAIGIAVFLAHIGFGVPASKLKMSLFDGILTNINVRDNILKGESFFYNEVRRIKTTIERVVDDHRWLVLIDELFKGTNIQDAMKCSTVVVQGLMKVRHSLFVLSTHLYEISEDLKGEKNIDFKYFETEMDGEDLHFSYQLRDGVSNDRLGYFILKREGVVHLLNSL